MNGKLLKNIYNWKPFCRGAHKIKLNLEMQTQRNIKTKKFGASNKSLRVLKTGEKKFAKRGQCLREWSRWKIITIYLYSTGNGVLVLWNRFL